MAVERIESEIDIRPGKGGNTGANGSSRKEDERSDSDDDDIEIVVQDDTPEQDRGRAPRDPKLKSAVPEDDEIGQYTKGVQDRMKQMKWEYHEERRAKEQWQREHGAAVDFAKKVHEENRKLRDLVTKGHKTLLDSNASATESEVSALKQSLQAAIESGDAGKAADIQEKLARAAARAENARITQPLSFPEEERGDNDQRPRGQERQQRQEVRLSESMQDWMAENPWFNQNKRMTAFAFGVHEELLEKGIPLESPRYFQEIDKAVRDSFSNYFEEEDTEDNDRNNDRNKSNRNGTRDARSGANGSSGANNGARGSSPPARRTNVGGVTRTASGRQGNRVTLTSSELAVAKRMGITPQQYAHEKVRLENQDG